MHAIHGTPTEKQKGLFYHREQKSLPLFPGKRSLFVFMTAMIFACVWFPGTGFPEKDNKDNSEFYAGPLSAVAKTIVEIKPQKLVANDPLQQIKKNGAKKPTGNQPPERDPGSEAKIKSF